MANNRNNKPSEAKKQSTLPENVVSLAERIFLQTFSHKEQRTVAHRVEESIATAKEFYEAIDNQ